MGELGKNCLIFETSKSIKKSAIDARAAKCDFIINFKEFLKIFVKYVAYCRLNWHVGVDSYHWDTYFTLKIISVF